MIKSFMLIAVSFLTGCVADCIDKKTGRHKASVTMAESKKNDVFRFEMKPFKSIFNLDSSQTFRIKNAWVENSWRYECINNNAVLVEDSTFQLVIDAKYSGDMDMSDYWLTRADTFQGGALGAHLGAQLDFPYHDQDTFYLLLNKQSDLSRKAQIVDTLRLIRDTYAPKY